MRLQVADVPEYVKEKARAVYESGGHSGREILVPFFDIDGKMGEVEVSMIDGSMSFFLFQDDVSGPCALCQQESTEDVCESCSEKILKPVVREVLKKALCDIIDRMTF
jgi:hypothetical protein